MDTLDISLEDFEEYFRAEDLKQGMNQNVYRTHIISSSNVIKYITFKLCNSNNNFKKAYDRYKNFKWLDDMENADEFKTVYEEYKSFIPDNLIQNIINTLKDSRKSKQYVNKKTKFYISNTIIKPDDVKTEEVDINW